MFKLFSRRPDYRSLLANLANHNIDAASSTAFADFLARADARELTHLNPRYLAESISHSERRTLRLLVAALYEGVVVLHWNVCCPVCGQIDDGNHSLGQLHHDTQCKMCKAEFSPQIDDEVFVTFSLHPRLRPLPPTTSAAAFRAAIDERLGRVPGHALLLLSDFQRLFPRERLLPEESLDVARATLLFTDLAGSTALYARRGDPRAYRLVRLHFDELFRIADEQSGTVVKTIGDAVMAAFQTIVDAVSAALAMQAAINALNQSAGLSGADRLILKIGLHSGPCLSVTLNDRPDYFGTTVNIAARVQGLSQGNDIALTEAIYHDHAAHPLIADYPHTSAHVQLKGITEQVLVHCLKLNPPTLHAV
jgi:class 3 adenylate cyclase